MDEETTQNKAVIEVNNLYKIFRVGTNKVRALNGVSFKVYPGEFCAIVGTSGSGKSTLLNMLAGLEKPTKGEIIIAGQHIEKMPEAKLVKFRRENIGFIFQSFNLLGTMNALENVALPLSFRGVPKLVRLKKAMKMLRLVGLGEHAKHRPNQMSGGQQQRVGMARALVVNPKIVFADEPTGNLDSKTSKEMMDLMRNVVNEHHKTLVMVTHDDSLAAIADKVIRIVDGKIVDEIFNLVCDVRNDLNRASSEVSMALLLQNAPINLTGSHVGILAKAFINDSFIVSQVQIRFCAIICNKNFPMLYRIHGSGIQIEIRIKLLHGYFIASGFQ